MNPETPTPFAHYYRGNQGRWRGQLRFTVTDARALGAAPIPAIDRARIRAMAAISRAFGFVWMHTRVDCDVLGEGRVLHETRLSRAGVTLLVGREVLSPRPDGRSGTMRIEHRFPPFGARTWDDGEVIVDEAGRCAVYDLPWVGGRLQQRTRPVPDALWIEQEGPFVAGEVGLMRISF